MLKKEVFLQGIPVKLHKKVSDKLIDEINNLVSDPIIRKNFIDNLITYTSVLRNSQYNIADYVNAVRYCTYRLMDHGIAVSYAKTFPNRYSKLLARGASQKDISAYASIYNKNKLVSEVLEQSLIPLHIMNIGVKQQAVNTLVGEMTDEKSSSRIKIDAADRLLHHLADPITNKVQIDVNVKDDSINELKNTTMELAKKQKEMLESGLMNAKQIAESNIVKVINPVENNNV